MKDAAVIVAARAASRLPASTAAVVAVAGPVAVGKSTLAEGIADTLRSDGAAVEVVSTDGFLFPTADLVARGMVDRKGFPESYDVAALRGFLLAVRVHVDDRTELRVPVYSHEVYDVLPAAQARVVPPCDVVVLEGVNALAATVGLVDFGVYVDADLDVIEAWYVQRFLHLCAAATPGSFYAQFSALDRRAQESTALDVYRLVNLPNLEQHIAPSRHLADVVVELGPDHGIAAIVDAESSRA